MIERKEPNRVGKYQLIKRQSCYHIETSQLICSANCLTGFYMMATLVFNELMEEYSFRCLSAFYTWATTIIFFLQWLIMNLPIMKLITYHTSLGWKRSEKISNLAEKNTLVSGHESDEKNLPLSGSKLIFFNRFSGDILFSSLVSFIFLYSYFFLVCLFFEIKKKYSDKYLTMRAVNEKIFFSRPISGISTSFFFGQVRNLSKVENLQRYLT